MALQGVPELALRCFAEIDDSIFSSSPQAINHFLNFHVANDQSVDFILLIGKPFPRLVKIAEEKQHSSLSHVAWIGDHADFEQFQRYRNDKESNQITSGLEVPFMLTGRESEMHPNNVTFKMIAAMRYALIDPSLPNVFGHAVGVSNADGGFEYRLTHSFSKK